MNKKKSVIVLHICDIKNPRGNGVAGVVPKCVFYQNKITPTALWDLNGNLVDNDINIIKNKKNISDLPSPFNKPNIVILHELYKFEYIKISKYCIENRIPYIVIPHGCMVEKAQKQKWLKKKLGNLIFYKRIFKKADAIQFLNIKEKENTKIKLDRIIISGFGIENSSSKNKPKKPIKFVYIGRYSIYTKGLDLLFDACLKNKEWFRKNNVQINLYGRISSKKDNIIFNLAKEKGIDDIFIVNNAIYGNDKSKVLCDAYAFIQTSRHEAQPQGIMEALSIGLPCIVTEGTSFAEYVNDKKCGIGIKPNSIEIFNAIKKIVSNQNDRKYFSENAIQNASKDFNWNSVAEEVIKKYILLVKEN